jgi:VanZ family protein
MKIGHIDRAHYLAVSGLMLLVTALFIPGDTLSAAQDWLTLLLKLEPSTTPPGAVPTDKIMHILLFALSTFLNCRAWPAISHRWRVIFGMTAMAVITELGQLWVPGRSGDLGDIAADLIGVMLGLVLFLVMRSSSAAS